MIRAPDFSACPRVHGRAYNGANGKKIAVEYDGAVWLVKFSPSAADKPSELSYTHSCLCEHIGSSVFRLLKIPAQETRLGLFHNGKSKIVCGCRDFTGPGLRLYDFCSIKNTVIDSETGGNGTELADVLETIALQNFVAPDIVLERFWAMFVVDALLGNFDRHNGNWGFLVDEQTGESSLAPVFDCGSCLLPQADERIMRAVLSDRAELDARIYTFPNSMLKINGRKINYREFLSAAAEPGLRAALDRLLPRVRTLDFSTLIDGVPFLSALQRDFYRYYLAMRREKIFEGL